MQHIAAQQAFILSNTDWFQQEGFSHLKWIRMAADQGRVLAQTALALSYEQGLVMPQDYIEAHKWWNLALYEREVVHHRKMSV